MHGVGQLYPRMRNVCHMRLTEASIDNLNYSDLLPSIYEALFFQILVFIIFYFYRLLLTQKRNIVFFCKVHSTVDIQGIDVRPHSVVRLLIVRAEQSGSYRCLGDQIHVCLFN